MTQSATCSASPASASNALTAPALAQQTRLYGPDGRSAGTATTDGASSTTFRDARGRIVGTSSTTSGGATTFRDPRGNVTGRAFTPRKDSRE
jgi:hypothetical protein